MTIGVKNKRERRSGASESLAAPEMLRWRTLRAAPDLRPGELHLWRIRTDGLGMDPAAGLSLLGERQLARAQRMRHALHRERYIRAQAGLRRILSLYLQVAPEVIAFEHGPAGKPYLGGGAHALSFNLTTTGDLALVGLCAGTGPEAELGVDCEWIHPRRDLQSVAERMFEPKVAKSLATKPEPERVAFFYQAWTALEADAKADGRGLFRPRAPGARRPAILHCTPHPGYVAAVARAALPPLSEWLPLDLEPV